MGIVAGAAVGFLCLVQIAAGQPGRGPGPSGHGPPHDPAFVADRELFFQLLMHRAAIRRDVHPIEHGVETLTESDDPQVAALIQKHVASMKRRVEEHRPIHRRDPLFAELFRHADQITFEYEMTPQGIRARETSRDPYVARLIQKHAQVVSLFLKHGPAEVRRNHDLPAQPPEPIP
jgi:hypothetical protein